MRSMVITAVLVAGSVSLLGQSARVKMGLWEKTMVNSTGDGSPNTVKSKSCITPEVWQEMMTNALKPHEGCKMNTVKTANGYSFSGTCNIAGDTSLMNGSVTIVDSEHMVTETHSTTTMEGKPLRLEIRSTSRYLSSSCGSVKPGDPEVEDQ